MLVYKIVGDSTSTVIAPGDSLPPGQYQIFKSFKVEQASLVILTGGAAHAASTFVGSC
jgi:hypothetical protein